VRLAEEFLYRCLIIACYSCVEICGPEVALSAAYIRNNVRVRVFDITAEIHISPGKGKLFPYPQHVGIQAE
jgi:hypothetical protein